MKVSLIQICEHCGHEIGEVLQEPFKNWVWKSGGELKVRLKTAHIPVADSETQLLFELKITLDEQPEDASHLVRDKQTLCGLSEWRTGNTDLAFGVRTGITNCIPCLKNFALELLRTANK